MFKVGYITYWLSIDLKNYWLRIQLHFDGHVLSFSSLMMKPRCSAAAAVQVLKSCTCAFEIVDSSKVVLSKLWSRLKSWLGVTLTDEYG